MKKLLQNIFFASCLLLIAGTVEAQNQSYGTTSRDGTTTYHVPELGGMNLTIKPLTPEEHAKAIQRDRETKEREQQGIFEDNTSINLNAKETKDPQVIYVEKLEAERVKLYAEKFGKEKAYEMLREETYNNLLAAYGEAGAKKRIQDVEKKLKEQLHID